MQASTRSLANAKGERHAIEAAALVLADAKSRLGITHAGVAMTSLPHKRIEEGSWKKRWASNGLARETRQTSQR
jgi:hypothetical protein